MKINTTIFIETQSLTPELATLEWSATVTLESAVFVLKYNDGLMGNGYCRNSVSE